MKERKTLISVLEFLRTLALAVLLVSLFMSFVLRPMQVAGDSMAPVLHDGERVFINVLGGMISEANMFLRTSQMFALTVTVLAAGGLIEWLFSHLKLITAKWSGEEEA